MAIIKCRECNKAISSMAAPCPGCGAPAFSRNKRNKTIGVKPQKSRTTAIFLTVFFGFIGGHRFYSMKRNLIGSLTYAVIRRY